MQTNANSCEEKQVRERPQQSLPRVIRSSLNAKLERLLARPLIACFQPTAEDEQRSTDQGQSSALAGWHSIAGNHAPMTHQSLQKDKWEENKEDSTWTIAIDIDYADLWRGKEKEISDTINDTVESPITYLTEEQSLLLKNSPREFLNLNPRPETTELLSFELDSDQRVSRLTVASLPKSGERARYLAVVPNLIQLQRQLDALDVVERADDEGPLGPLRALIGLCPLPGGLREALFDAVPYQEGRFLDEFQSDAIQKAMATPHFAVIHGPPGSGKTTVISSIIKQVTSQGGNVLVVSPTHVAVDNVVEKLVAMASSEGRDHLEPHTLPVRYAARRSRLSSVAIEYWVGNKDRLRDSIISKRLKNCLSKALPFVPSLYAIEDTMAAGIAPLSKAISGIEQVICGTSIGILSYAPVKAATPGAFDLLVVDEVSKMTLPEFLAIAVKARRWILVGDPEQLPPFQDCAENATTLDEVLIPVMELACSIGAILEHSKPMDRVNERLLVVSSNPILAVAAIRAHLEEVRMNRIPSISVFGEVNVPGVVVCLPGEVPEASRQLLPVANRDRTHRPDNCGGLRILVERGQAVPRPAFGGGTRFVEERDRAQAKIFEVAFNVYHSQPWATRNSQKLSIVSLRNGLDKYLPSMAAMTVLNCPEQEEVQESSQAGVIAQIASYFAVNTVSVYDWLTGMPSHVFDVSPLIELKNLFPGKICEEIRPYNGKLQKQYRMHSSLSEVPRKLFYSGQALLDGRADKDRESRVMLIQVSGDTSDGCEANLDEGEMIYRMLIGLSAKKGKEKKVTSVMVITPYRAQMALIAKGVAALQEAKEVSNLSIEVLTLDRCQGREADYVLISLVREGASQFFELPKRWNVALTRAKEALALIGNINAYVLEAQHARLKSHVRVVDYPSESGNDNDRPRMSLLARIIESYQLQHTRFN